eukprot:COSAG02_NODE_4925_length_4831_cov_2.178149_2_plen_113_part_00
MKCPSLSFTACCVACSYDRSRVNLVQEAADGTEFVMVNAIELDYLEEFGDEHSGQAANGRELSWADTMEFLDSLLERGTQPDQILAHAWRPGQLVICEHLLCIVIDCIPARF